MRYAWHHKKTEEGNGNGFCPTYNQLTISKPDGTSGELFARVKAVQGGGPESALLSLLNLRLKKKSKSKSRSMRHAKRGEKHCRD